MIYQLFLPSQYGTQVGGVTSNMRFQVNWDDLFQRKNLEYKTCRVRFHFQSTTLQSTIGPAASGTWEYYARTGYLAANFSGAKQATVMPVPRTGRDLYGVSLGIISPNTIMSYTADGSAANVSSWISYQNSTLQTKGVEISTPTGTGDLNLQLYCWYSTTATSPTLMTYDGDYEVVLEFELLEDD